MTFESTPQRQAYLDARGKSILLACPGSGKTTCVVYKLKSIIKECEQGRNRGAGILCLSFTNKAADEIKQRYYELHGESISYPHEVCTIDSFVTRYIVMPFWYLYQDLNRKPTIINERNISRSIYYAQKANHDEVMLSCFTKYGRGVHTFKPEFLSLSEQGYQFFGDSVNKAVKENEVNLLNYSREVWLYRVGKGLLDSTDALWIARTLLAKNQDIAQSLAKRFPYIIVDEAQDTSQWQFDIFESLRNAGVENMEFVGDLNQSIYEWREAKPGILNGYSQNGEWNVLHLTENRRSVQRIIDFYSRLKPVGTPAITSHNVADKKIAIDIFRYDGGDERGVLSAFLHKCDQHELNNRLILARGKSEIRRLAAEKSADFKPWKRSIPYRLIEAQLCYNSNEIKEAVRILRRVVAEIICGEREFENQNDFIDQYEKDVNFNVTLLSILSSLSPLNSSFNDWGNTACTVLKDKLKLAETPDFVIKKRIPGGYENMTHPVSAYYGKHEDKSVSAQTIHSVKGASVDAVLLFIESKKSSNGISIKNIPNKPGALQQNEIKERHRLIYVACSRAKQYLALAVPSAATEAELAKQFRGLEVNIISEGVQQQLFE